MQNTNHGGKHLPERRCIGCGEHFPKNTLVRVVRCPDGNIRLDLSGRMAGRGAYLCKSAKCLRLARRARRIEQNLSCAMPESLYDVLEAELNGAES